MTYCVGMCLKDGLVMLSDSRTSAGVDNIATFRKMTVWERPGERFLVLLSAGNLGVTQTIVNHLEAGLDPDARRLTDVPSMFHAAQLVGEAIRLVYRIHGKALEEMNAASFNVSFLLGGQIMGDEHRLFEIYAAGNFIQASDRTPFLQIGEHKYGKPILDRALAWETDLRAAAKLALVSMDSTLRSNLSVGLPLDLVVYRRDAFAPEIRRTIDGDDPYFRTIRDGWSRSLREAHQRLPDVPW
ncbi:MAG TPA: proteasome-type protease [Vineibacter sp.]|nr:proteasome-type protease [Vineibacter sp.]